MAKRKIQAKRRAKRVANSIAKETRRAKKLRAVIKLADVVEPEALAPLPKEIELVVEMPAQAQSITWQAKGKRLAIRIKRFVLANV